RRALRRSFPTRRSSDLDDKQIRGEGHSHLELLQLRKKMLHCHAFQFVSKLGLEGRVTAFQEKMQQLLVFLVAFKNLHDGVVAGLDRKSTRLNSSHVKIS